MSIEAMKQALEALEHDTEPEAKYGINTATTILRTAIEQAEKQEPVGEVMNERGEVDYISYVPPAGTLLYTTPPAAPVRERNFCERCGKRLGGEGHIHTCTPPAKNQQGGCILCGFTPSDAAAAIRARGAA